MADGKCMTYMMGICRPAVEKMHHWRFTSAIVDVPLRVVSLAAAGEMPVKSVLLCIFIPNLNNRLAETPW